VVISMLMLPMGLKSMNDKQIEIDIPVEGVFPVSKGGTSIGHVAALRDGGWLSMPLSAVNGFTIHKLRRDAINELAK